MVRTAVPRRGGRRTESGSSAPSAGAAKALVARSTRAAAQTSSSPPNGALRVDRDHNRRWDGGEPLRSAGDGTACAGISRSDSRVAWPPSRTSTGGACASNRLLCRCRLTSRGAKRPLGSRAAPSYDLASRCIRDPRPTRSQKSHCQGLARPPQPRRRRCRPAAVVAAAARTLRWKDAPFSR